MYDVLEVAATIIEECIEMQKPVSMLHLHNILYYTQVLFIQVKGEFCFDDEFVKGEYGVRNDSVWKFYRRHSSLPITDLFYEKFEFVDGNFVTLEVKQETIKSLSDRKLVRTAVEHCLSYRLFELGEIVKQEKIVQATILGDRIPNEYLRWSLMNHQPLISMI